MSRVLLLASVPLLLSGIARAQRPGSSAPQRFSLSGDGGPVDTVTSQFDVDGVRVILRRNTANDVVAANVYLLGGTRQLTPQTQGIETLLLAASERGTRHYPGEMVRRRTAQLGSTIVLDPSEDWTVFGLRAIRSTFDSTWAILADRIMYPTLDSSQVDVVRGQLLTGLQQQHAQPDAELEWLADSALFANHPYGLAPQGSEESLSHLTIGQMRSYEAARMVTSRMLVVVVGNVDRDDVQRLVRSTLARLPRGSFVWQPPAPPEPHVRDALIRRSDLPTNYVLGYYIGPPAGTRDYDALRLASAVLSGRFFTEIRSKRNLTYAVEAPFVGRAFAIGGIYVTTVQPDSVLEIMRAEVSELQRDVIDPAGLQRLVQQFITDYYLKNETNGDQATLLARAALYDGDYRAAGRFVENLRRVTPEDIRRVAQTYMHDVQFVYIGDPAKLSQASIQKFE